MHPDAIKVPEQVDFDIVKDITKCTYEIPYSREKIYRNLYVINYLSLPNPFQFGWLGTLNKALSIKTYLAPLVYMRDWYVDIMNQDSMFGSL